MKNNFQALVDAVKMFDCEPGIYNVALYAAAHYSNYRAVAVFRSPHDSGGARDVSAYGNSPEAAMAALFSILKEKWGRCPHCDGYMKGDQDDS